MISWDDVIFVNIKLKVMRNNIKGTEYQSIKLISWAIKLHNYETCQLHSCYQ